MPSLSPCGRPLVSRRTREPSGIGLARFVKRTHAGAVALRQHVDVRIGGALARRAAADLEVHGVAIGAVDQAVAIGRAGLPAGGVAGPEYRLALVLAQH